MLVDYDKLYEEKGLAELEHILNINFDDKVLLVRAFIHSSYCSENNNNYQRLEFLGDSVLQIAVSDYMYRNLPDEKEGDMSKKRARLVSEYTLSKVVRNNNFDKYIIIGKSVLNDYQQLPDSFVADVFESLTAAIYLDQGYLEAEKFLNNYLIREMDELLADEQTKDYKTHLQEILQVNGSIDIKYITQKTTDNYFESELFYEGIIIGKGNGKSKKQAEQQAAKKAIETKL